MRPRLNENAARHALDVLSSAEQGRYETMAAPARESFLAGRLLLRRLAAELTGDEPGAVDLVAVCPDCGGPHGRPELPGTGLHLSLTRRDDVIVAAAWDAPIGVDIERDPPTPAALDAISRLTGDAALTRWTRVEAVLKADGRGLRVDPGAVELTHVGAQIEGTVVGSTARYRVDEVELAPGITVSIACALPAASSGQAGQRGAHEPPVEQGLQRAG